MFKRVVKVFLKGYLLKKKLRWLLVKFYGEKYGVGFRVIVNYLKFF